MVELDNVSASYGKNTVFESLNFQFNRRIYGITGMNGAGKTTLLKIIAGVLRCQGSITSVLGTKYTEQLLYLPTVPFFYPKMTGREYLDFFFNARSIPRTDMIPSWNNEFNLPLENYVDTYSSGMKKKLALMAMLTINSPIMVLDEPFVSLDVKSIKSVCSILNSQHQKVNNLVIIASHNQTSLAALRPIVLRLEHNGLTVCE